MIRHEALMEMLNWEKVVEAIHTVPLKQPDYADAAKMVLAAFRKWAAWDFSHAESFLTEQHFGMAANRLETVFGVDKWNAFSGGGVRGVIDLAFTLDGGAVRVVDWKTVTITPEKRTSLGLSWQGRIYSTALRAASYTYRLVQRDGRTTDVTLDWPNASYSEVDVKRYLRRSLTERLNETARNEPFRRNMPYACGAFGRPCAHLDLCAKSNQAPAARDATLALLDVSFSPSGLETWSLCPERYRLDRVIGKGVEGEDTTAADLGTAFHAGVAACWSQFNELQGEGLKT